MAGDQLQALNGLFQILGCLVGNVLVAGAVEAVAAHSRTSRSTRRGWRTYKPSAAWCCGRRCRTQPPWECCRTPCGRPRYPEYQRVVQGSQRAQLTQGVDDLIGDQAAALELPRRHARRGDRWRRSRLTFIDALACTGGHLLHDLGKSLGVGGEDLPGWWPWCRWPRE